MKGLINEGASVRNALLCPAASIDKSKIKKKKPKLNTVSES